jgi:hypothetical protein
LTESATESPRSWQGADLVSYSIAGLSGFSWTKRQSLRQGLRPRVIYLETLATLENYQHQPHGVTFQSGFHMGGDSRLGTWVFGARKLQVSRGAATNFVVNFIASFVETLKTVLTESATEGPRSWGSCQLCHLLNRRLCRGLRGRNDKVYDKA